MNARNELYPRLLAAAGDRLTPGRLCWILNARPELMMPRGVVLDLIVALSLRPDRTADNYNDKLDLGLQVAELQRAACMKLCALGPREARPALPAVVSVLPGAPVAACVAACCNASQVRRAQLDAKLAALAALQHIGLVDGSILPPDLVDSLLAPPGMLLALPTAELLARAGAIEAHLEVLCRAIEHPRWQVVKAVVRALSRVDHPSALRGLEAALHHDDARVVEAAVRALRRRERSPHTLALLGDVVRRSSDTPTRYEALKAMLDLAAPEEVARCVERRLLEERRGPPRHPGLSRLCARIFAGSERP
jgi:hypothetical protein